MLKNKVTQAIFGVDDIWDRFHPDANFIDHQGWNGFNSLLTELNKDFDEQIIVDLGVWKGQSTITLAENLRSNNINGVVIAVDTFLGSPEHQKRNFYKLFSGGRPSLYETFLNNIWNKGLQDYIIPLPQTTIGACHILKRSGLSPTFVHVDAAHEYEEVKRDIEEYYEILRPDGVMVCDDYVDGWPGVMKAVDEFAKDHDISLIKNFPKCMFTK